MLKVCNHFVATLNDQIRNVVWIGNGQKVQISAQIDNDCAKKVQNVKGKYKKSLENFLCSIILAK